MKWSHEGDDDAGGDARRFGRAVLLGTALSAGCWAVIAGAVLLAARWLVGG